MGWHAFCSAECVVKYVDANKNIPWLKSEAYQMYYELDFDNKTKDLLSETTDEPKDRGHKDDAVLVVADARPESAGNASTGTEGVEGPSGANVCLCRSGVLTKLKQKLQNKDTVDTQQKPKSNCSNKNCACFTNYDK
jgi:hypothetical protein